MSLGGCKDDAVTTLPSSAYFVAMNSSATSVIEGDTVTFSVYAAAQAGDEVNVTFEVTGENKDGSALVADVDFVILNHENQPLTSNNITLENGIGAVEFKIAIPNDTLSNAGRTLTVSLTGNSANYTLGMDNGKEGKTIVLPIKDDDIVITIDELVGAWTMEEDYIASSEGVAKYEVTVTKINATQINIRGLGEFELSLSAVVDVTSKVKRITIPYQQVTTLNSGYDTWFTTSEAFFINTAPALADLTVWLEKDENNIITLEFGRKGDNSDGYMFGAFTKGTTTLYSFFKIGGIPGIMTKQ
jgi:hypothetical protein